MTAERSEHLRLELDLLEGEARGPDARRRDGAGDLPTILLVGPDPDLRRYMAHCIEAERGAGGLLEASGDEAALRWLASRPVALLIAEEALSGPQRAELCRRARQLTGRELPILLIVAHPVRPDEEAEYRAQGATRVLAKPFNAAKLCGLIEELLQPGGSGAD